MCAAVGFLGLRVVGLGFSGNLMRVLFLFVVACWVLGSWLLVFWISHSLHDCFCFCALGLGLFDGSGFEGMRVLGVLGVSLFDPMTLKPGSAASRSVNNSTTLSQPGPNTPEGPK